MNIPEEEKDKPIDKENGNNKHNQRCGQLNSQTQKVKEDDNKKNKSTKFKENKAGVKSNIFKAVKCNLIKDAIKHNVEEKVEQFEKQQNLDELIDFEILEKREMTNDFVSKILDSKYKGIGKGMLENEETTLIPELDTEKDKNEAIYDNH